MGGQAIVLFFVCVCCLVGPTCEHFFDFLQCRSGCPGIAYIYIYIYMYIYDMYSYIYMCIYHISFTWFSVRVSLMSADCWTFLYTLLYSAIILAFWIHSLIFAFDSLDWSTCPCIYYANLYF